MTQSVLLVEDDPEVRHGFAQALSLAEVPVTPLPDAESVGPHLHPEVDAVVVTDVRLPGENGLALLRRILAIDREIPVVIVTGHGDVSMAVEAMRDGAYDFIEKPFPSDRLVEVARRALAQRRLVLENRALKEELLRTGEGRLVGESPAAQRLRRLVAGVAPTGVDVLLRGETGTGKEVVARAIHEASGRTGPFVALNCGAIPESIFESEVLGHEAGAFTGAVRRRVGKVEHANGGTLFLDEIESMPLGLQVKLLRVVQERVVERLGGNELAPVDVRIVAATKADLRGEVAAGRFREDLMFRLDVVSIDLPPLRDRREDIPLLFAWFVARAALRHGRPAPRWTAAEMDGWMARAWPGNVRELRNAAERFCLGIPEAAAEPERPGTLADRVERFERALIVQALERARGNVAEVAEALGIPKKTLYDKLKRHALDPERFRHG